MPKMDWLFFSFYEDNSIFEIPYQDEISKERRGKYHGNATGRKEKGKWENYRGTMMYASIPKTKIIERK